MPHCLCYDDKIQPLGLLWKCKQTIDHDAKDTSLCDLLFFVFLLKLSYFCDPTTRISFSDKSSYKDMIFRGEMLVHEILRVVSRIRQPVACKATL